jgi:hypothetical protein
MELKDREKMNRMGLSLQHPDVGEDTLERIVTGDESWEHHCQPESEPASVQWKHPSSSLTRKFKVTPSDGKVVLTVFCGSQGILLSHFQKRGRNVNSALYCEVLLKLRDAIRRKVPGQLARGV